MKPTKYRSYFTNEDGSVWFDPGEGTLVVTTCGHDRVDIPWEDAEEIARKILGLWQL